MTSSIESSSTKHRNSINNTQRDLSFLLHRYLFLPFLTVSLLHCIVPSIIIAQLTLVSSNASTELNDDDDDVMWMLTDYDWLCKRMRWT